MKRIYRNDMGQAQKDKIAAANTGKHHTPETKRKISQSMCKYWAGLPFKPATDTGNTSGTTTGTGTVPGGLTPCFSSWGTCTVRTLKLYGKNIG